MTDLVLSEVFGPTLQGEGVNAGEPAYFVRLGRCNLDCAWCDTPYTWDWRGKNGPAQDPKALYKQAPAELAAQLDAAPRIVVTGGEPLLQRTALAEFAKALDPEVPVEVETNGTFAPIPGIEDWQFNVSPKLANSGVRRAVRIVPDALDYFAAMAEMGAEVYFKFVVCAPADVEEIIELEEAYGLSNIVVMPEGRTTEAVIDGMRALAPLCIEHGWRLSPRTHVLLWGDERGR